MTSLTPSSLSITNTTSMSSISSAEKDVLTLSYSLNVPGLAEKRPSVLVGMSFLSDVRPGLHISQATSFSPEGAMLPKVTGTPAVSTSSGRKKSDCVSIAPSDLLPQTDSLFGSN